RIEFAAVATHATVLVNGVECGQHLGGWTPFRIDATAAVKWGEANVLEVVVDERVGHNTQGFLPIIQPHFGGIWQDVTLCLDSGPVIDRLAIELFGEHRTIAFGNSPCRLRWNVPVLGGSPATDLAVEVVGLEARGQGSSGTIDVPLAVPWSPDQPTLHDLRIVLRRGDEVLDRVERRIGFRSLAASGTTISWNGSPLQVRGILHWGYSPPALAPPVDRTFWRRQLEEMKALGFNCLKCCLWVPPQCVYELCDELGLLIWQEYPTWHPQMDQAHKQELLTEYEEFFANDRSHCSVAFRSITCETGHSADLDVVKTLFEACKAACPQTLVVDDSSWIGWQRITDFWDEHPYGNNSWFPGRLEEFERHIAEKGEKPLLLGECIAADTWVDRAAFTAKWGAGPSWWRPLCWDSQAEVEPWLAAEFGQATVDSLLPESLAFGLRNRKFQIEQLRLSIPDAGYVVSVARDFAKARMGLYDDQDRLKWNAADWAWHRDTMLCLVTDGPSRAVGPPFDDRVGVRVSHFGRGPLDGELRLWCEDPKLETRVPVRLAPGTTSEEFELRIECDRDAPTRLRVHAALSGSHPASNAWDLWWTPLADDPADDVVVAERLTPELLAELEHGARVLLLAGDRPGSARTEPLWFLRGAPFAPPHPLRERVPPELLLELSSFDLESGRVMPWQPWRDEVDPILAFWDTHDIAETRLWLHAFETRVGEGRLLATTLRLRESGSIGGIGTWLESALRHHLTSGAAPQRALSAATIAALRQKLNEKKLDLPVWRFRTDPENNGRTANWQDPALDVTTAAWRDLKAGSHWENQGDDLKHYTGVAWYRVDVDIPADWQGLPARCVFDGVDDSFDFWLDGEHRGTFGDEVRRVTIWLETQVAELGPLTPGRHTLVLRVVDHAGAGGLWKPVWLTTGPVGDKSRLLH
ncbi:MAG: hypothetical protein KDE27_16490, partial [Planctomycetes bacterium]|nr:hypothetical protein [Planctomycetota bacterium]